MASSDVGSSQNDAASSQSSNFYSIFRIEHYTKAPSRKSDPRRTPQRRQYICLHCHGPEWSNPHKGNAINHARSKHSSIFIGSQASQSSRPSISSFVVSRSSDTSLRNCFNRQKYIEAIIALLTLRRVAFSAVEWPELQDLALACNPAIKDLLITSRRTALRHIDVNFGLYRDQLKEKLQSAQSMIHLSSDLWASPHRHSLLAVCAQWVSGDYQLQKALLGLPECRYSHSGERQADLIVATLANYGISRIGYHTSDNATSNDTCLEALSQRLSNFEVGQLVSDPASTNLINSLTQPPLIQNSAVSAVSAISSISPFRPSFLPIRKKHLMPPLRLLARHPVPTCSSSFLPL